MKLWAILFASYVVTNLPSTNALAQDGSLDLSFNTSGKVTTPLGTFDDVGHAMALQSDGKIVVAGQTYNSSDYDFFVLRYNTDGSLDKSFNSGGKVAIPVGANDDMARAVAIQSDGKIVVGGMSYNGTKDVFAVIRLHSDGSMDTSFSHNGKVTTSIGTTTDNIMSVAIQNDGKIVAAGFATTTGNMDFAAVRYTQSGVLDATFDGDGIVTTSLSGGNDIANTVKIQSDGKIVLAGSSFVNTNFDFALLRYNADGSVDNSFGTNGKVTTAIAGTFNEYGNGMTMQNDGKIIMVGSSNSTFNDFILARYNVDGSLDNTFGNSGITITDLGTSTDKGEATCVVLQADNKIVVAGNRDNGTQLDYALARYHSDGKLDSTFGTNGLVSTDFSGKDDGGRSVAIQTDGKILVAGGSYDGSQSNCAVARYNNAKTGSVLPFSAFDHVKLFPNPSTTFTNLNCAVQLTNATVDLYDAFGRLLTHKEGVFGDHINLESNVYSVGVYFIIITQKHALVLNEKMVMINP